MRRHLTQRREMKKVSNVRTDSHNLDSLRREKCVMETLKLGVFGAPFQTSVHPRHAGREPRARCGMTNTHCRGASLDELQVHCLHPPRSTSNGCSEQSGLRPFRQKHRSDTIVRPQNFSPQSAPMTPGDRTKAAQSLHRICRSFPRSCLAPSL